MSLVTSILVIAIAIVIYIYMIEVFTILFRITGLTKEKARFQVISMITCSGYTTSEAEIITTNKRRRRLAVICMITGTIFNVLIISLLINLISNISQSEIFREQIIWVLIILGSALLLVIIFKLPIVSRIFEKLTENIANKIFYRNSSSNTLTMLDSYNDDAIVEIKINNIPEVLKDKSLMESNFKTQYNLNLMMLKRGNRTIEVTKDTIIQNKDSIIVFGKKQTIKDLFTYKTDVNYETEVLEKKAENELTLIDNYGSDAMAEVDIHVIPEILKGKTLMESDLRKVYNVTVLMIKRDERPLKVTKDSIIQENDTIVVFGNYNSIKKALIESKKVEQ